VPLAAGETAVALQLLAQKANRHNALQLDTFSMANQVSIGWHWPRLAKEALARWTGAHMRSL
jgi:hypothetical protein